MNNITKPLVVFLLCIICISILLTQTKSVTNRWTEKEFSYALRVATQDATSVLMDENYTLDGDTEEAQNISINLTRATEQFRKSFKANIGSFVEPALVNNMNIPLVGYVGYRSIAGQLSDGTNTFPYAYTTMKNNCIYNFTLGNTIYVTDLKTNVQSVLDISKLPEHYFHSELSNQDFRTTTVMSAISTFLSLFNEKEYNLVAQNAGSGLVFELGKTDYSGDPSIITEFSSVIDGPGFFAITDMMDSQLTGTPVRTFTFGGSELVSKY